MRYHMLASLLILTQILVGCTKGPPKCSDDRTTDLVRKIILDQIGGSEGLTEKEIKDNMKIEYSRASAFDEKIKVTTHPPLQNSSKASRRCNPGFS